MSEPAPADPCRFCQSRPPMGCCQPLPADTEAYLDKVYDPNLPTDQRTALEPGEARPDDLHMVRAIAILGHHRKGCSGEEPFHHACWITAGHAVERICLPFYDALRAQLAQAEVELQKVYELVTHHAEATRQARAERDQLLHLRTGDAAILGQRDSENELLTAERDQARELWREDRQLWRQDCDDLALARAVVEAAREYRRLAHAQEIHEDGCGDSPCETCAVAAGLTVEAERILFAALDQARAELQQVGAVVEACGWCRKFAALDQTRAPDSPPT